MIPAALFALALPLQGAGATPLPQASPVWSIAPGGLVWNGEPYRPVGVRVSGDPKAIAEVRAQGANDLLVELPAGGDWRPALEALKGSRYMIAIGSATPMAVGRAVLPQSYRVEGVTGTAPISVALPGAESAFVAVALKRDASLVWSGTVPVVDGIATFTPKSSMTAAQVALIYPVGPSLKTEDLWEGLDAYRDGLVSRLRGMDREGLRGLVDPFGTTARASSGALDVVPTSPLFRMEFAEALSTKYRNMLSLMTAWGVQGSDLDSFEEAARLVPLWRESRGIGYVLDPQTGRTYRVEQKRSELWRDLTQTVAAARERRLARVLASMRRELRVPIIQEWTGWSPLTDSPRYGFDGVAFEAVGGGFARTVGAASRPLSALSRSRPGGLLIATDLDLGPTPTPEVASAALGDLETMGLGAAYLTRRTWEALGTSRPTLASPSGVRPLYFPENALNPALPQKLTGDQWWLPAPMPGGRIDLGPGFNAYRYEGPEGSGFALWSATAPQRVKLLSSTPKALRFLASDGTELDPKIEKDGVTLTLPALPVIVTGTDALPIPKAAIEAQEQEVLGFERLAAERKLDIGEELYPLTNLKALKDQDPAKASALLARVLRRVRIRYGDFVWIEAESAKTHSFGEVLEDFSASDDGAMALDAALAADAPNAINFTVAARAQGDVELWVAAKISPENLKRLSVRVNGQSLVVKGPPVGAYGAGYAWYPMGTTRLSGAQNEVAVQIRPRLHDPLAIDALLIARPGTVPDGVRVPSVELPPPPKGR